MIRRTLQTNQFPRTSSTPRAFSNDPRKATLLTVKIIDVYTYDEKPDAVRRC